jgi:hypothetical protein
MRCQRVVASKTMKFHSKENDYEKDSNWISNIFVIAW